MLEIPFLVPDSVHDRVRQGRWGTCSHATDIRKRYALLNAGVVLPSRERWDMRVKADAKRYAEGVYALRDTENIHTYHHQYSHGAELWNDGNLVTMDFKITTPSAEGRGFRPIDSGTKGGNQC
eukprot:9001297-Pyramimonas_sp.AAC.1